LQLEEYHMKKDRDERNQETAFSLAQNALDHPGQQSALYETYGYCSHVYHVFASLRRQNAEESLYYDDDFIEPAYRGWGYYSRLVAKVFVKSDERVRHMAPRWAEDRSIHFVHQIDAEGNTTDWVDCRADLGARGKLPLDPESEAKLVVFDAGQIVITPSLIPLRACYARVDTEYEKCELIRSKITNAWNQCEYPDTRKMLSDLRCFPDKTRGGLVSVERVVRPAKIMMEALDIPR
jgi:hypothetical protein